MTQRSLFTDDAPAGLPDAAPVRRMARATDPATSHAAAAQHVASGANAAQRAACLAVMGGAWMTSDEIAEAAGIERHAAARRLPELARDGLVERGPAKLSTVGGRKGVTWRKRRS
jgi:hypothetical protein